MQPEQPPVTNTPAQPPTPQTPLQPIAQFECWGVPSGGRGILAYRKHTAVVYPGWLVLYRMDHTEAARIPLSGDLKVKYFFGFGRVAYTQGQKISLWNQKYIFNFGPIWPYALFIITVIIDLIVRLVFFPQVSYPDEPGYWWRFFGPGMTLLVFIIMAVINMPQAKAFKAACYRAARVAS